MQEPEKISASEKKKINWLHDDITKSTKALMGVLFEQAAEEGKSLSPTEAWRRAEKAINEWFLQVLKEADHDVPDMKNNVYTIHDLSAHIARQRDANGETKSCILTPKTLYQIGKNTARGSKGGSKGEWHGIEKFGVLWCAKLDIVQPERLITAVADLKKSKTVSTPSKVNGKEAPVGKNILASYNKDELAVIDSFLSNLRTTIKNISKFN